MVFQGPNLQDCTSKDGEWTSLSTDRAQPGYQQISLQTPHISDPRKLHPAPPLPLRACAGRGSAQPQVVALPSFESWCPEDLQEPAGL